MADVSFLQLAKDEINDNIIYMRERINDMSPDAIDPYLHITKLTPVYTESRTWESMGLNNVAVMADIIALDAPFPLKSRPSYDVVRGEMQKIASTSTWNETEMMDVKVMLNSSNERIRNQAIQKIADDVTNRYVGVHEKLLAILYQELSNEGAAVFAPVIETTAPAGSKDNVGLGIRIDAQFRASQILAASIPWTDATNATPLDDIELVLEAARKAGFRITEANTDRATLMALLSSAQLRNAMASANLALTMAPTIDQANAYFLANYRFQWVIRDHNFMEERNGKQTAVEMWKEGAIAFVGSNLWGSLVYTDPLERTEPAAGYEYELPDNYVTIGTTTVKPFGASWMRIIEGQGIAVPVVNRDNIVTLDTNGGALAV